MSDFDDQFSASFTDLLDMYGQSVVYRPGGGTPRTITAIVNNAPPEPTPGIDNAPVAKCIVRALSDASNATYGGIDPAAVDTGRDKIDVPLRSGGTAYTLRVTQVQNDNGGVTSLAVS